MRFLLTLLGVGLMLLGVSASATAMPMHDSVAAEPAGVTVTDDNWARDKYAAAAAAADRSAPISVGDNWARDKYAAQQAAGAAAASELPAAPLPDPATPWIVYAGIALALAVGLGVLLRTRMPRFHMPHGA